ncbi:DEAD/DEAH box helicase [Candidatus Dependentiae bacterium]|nr:DEAD/DEAH box helicase [Candidatus Dependentiae bacterium]
MSTNSLGSFNDFSLHAQIKQALTSLGLTTPTPIQAQALPVLLDNSRTHFHGQAQTGTGKTLAFGLPLLQDIDPAIRKVQALVVAPTRELADQIYQSLIQVARYRGISIVPIYGGMPIDRQMRELNAKPHLVIGTPGRLNDHIQRRTLSLADIKIVVLDEADTMLDMGFKDEVEEIINMTPANRSIWLFSATVKSGISDLMKSHMPNPVSVRINSTSIANASTKQFYAVVSRRQRFEALSRILESEEDMYGFIFCPTKIITGEVAELLGKRGYKAKPIHGDMSQSARNQVIKGFKNREFSFLVATDVAARGIDVAGITHVINYGLPEDQESYIHRIGRTGRAGKEGVAITIIDPQMRYRVNSLARRYNVTIEPMSLPTAEEINQKRVQKIYTAITQQARKELSKPAEVALSEQLSSLSQGELIKALVSCSQQLYGAVAQEGEDLNVAPSSDDRGGDRSYRPRRFGGGFSGNRGGGRRSSGGFGGGRSGSSRGFSRRIYEA